MHSKTALHGFFSRHRLVVALAVACLSSAVGGCSGPANERAATASGGGGEVGAAGASNAGAGFAGIAGMTNSGGAPASAGFAGSAGALVAGGSANAGPGGNGGSSTEGGASSGGTVAAGFGGSAGAAAGASGAGGSSGSSGSSGSLKAVMVVQAAGTPTAGDKVMVGRLTARGIQTAFFSDGAVTAAAVAGMSVVVISSSAESGPLGKKLRDIAIPVLCIENGEYALMGMTAATLNTDYGQLAGQTQVQIASGGSPLVGALSGAVTLSNTAGDFGWGIPGPAALKGATVFGNPSRFAVFGYAKGDQMVGMVAPAKRAAFAIRETIAANLSSEGSKLFDAVLNWVLL
jgi:hypothetical protein